MKSSNKIEQAGLLLTALLLVLLSGSCKKFLDTRAQGSYNLDDYPYPTGSGPYDQFLFGAYNELRAFNLHSQSFITAFSIRSDDADKGSTPTDGGANASDMDNFPVKPENGFANTLWIGNYGLIDKCNQALKSIRDRVDIVASEEVKNQSIAEARFLRAYGYFNLVRLFGRVPLIDSTGGAANVPQSTAAQIYAFIESDLDFARTYLQPSWDPTKFPGRVTSGSANGLLAKVYLTQKKWGQAMSAANAVMTSGQYNLSTPYTTIFGESGENSKESVFEVQATATSAIPTTNGVQYAQIQGVRGAGVWDLGWGWNSPSTYLEAAYEPNDPRKARTIMYTSAGSTTVYGDALPSGLPNPRYNHKVYTNPAMRASIGNRFGYWMNIRLLRYADVVLMYAEAANEVGGAANITLARNAVNTVRARARQGAPNGTLPDITTNDQTELRNAIRQERRIELAMEHDRFFDLVRWGVAQAVLNASGKPNFVDSRDVLLPIPQTQIDISGKLLTQNPGY